MLTKGDKGDKVRRMQLGLLHRGYALPRFGADGSLGDETLSVVADYLRDEGNLVRLSSVVSDDVVEALATGGNAATAGAAPTPGPAPTGEITHDELELLDVRLYVMTPAGLKRGLPAVPQARAGAKSRPVADIDSVCLHQTATLFAPWNDEQKLAKARRRVANIDTHLTILQDGSIVMGHSFATRVAHAQRFFNNRSIGLDFDGRFPGVEGDLTTFWKPKTRPWTKPTELTDAQVESGLALLAWLYGRHQAWRYIHAHRQTSASRRSDPGGEVWRRVAIPTYERFGLSYGGPNWFVPHDSGYATYLPQDCRTQSGPGKPIPKEWDPSATASYASAPRKRESPPASRE